MSSHCYAHTDKNDHTSSITSNLLNYTITEDGTIITHQLLVTALYDQTGNHDISPSDIVIAPLPLGTGKQIDHKVLNHHEILHIIRITIKNMYTWLCFALHFCVR